MEEDYRNIMAREDRLTELENELSGSKSSSNDGLCPRVLHLTLKKKWFDMIAAGIKKEEYREMKPYWHKRLLNKSYDVGRFMHGYAKDSPTLTVEYIGLESSLGILEWGAPEGKPVYILKLGKILGA